MKQDKIYKYSEFLNENLEDTPEQYVFNALSKLKNKLEKMFAHAEADKEGEIKRFGEPEKKEGEGGEGMTFKDLGLQLQSLELSKYSKIYDNIKMKFSDEKYLYDILFTIDLKDAVPEDEEKDFSDNDIENCYIKFKKYDADTFNLIGQITKTVKLKDINEEMLINLKIELDDEYGGEEEEFSLETEEK
jgi:hypothetical protein